MILDMSWWQEKMFDLIGIHFSFWLKIFCNLFLYGLTDNCLYWQFSFSFLTFSKSIKCCENVNYASKKSFVKILCSFIYFSEMSFLTCLILFRVSLIDNQSVCFAYLSVYVKLSVFVTVVLSAYLSVCPFCQSF